MRRDHAGGTNMTSQSTLTRSFPTLANAFRWIGRTRRRKWTAAAVFLAIVAGPPLWWRVQLFGLPDIGEPFDAKAFRAFRIPDEDNAHPLYLRAIRTVKPPTRDLLVSSAQFDPLVPWSAADPEVRAWAEQNREAMELYRQASDRPDDLGPVPRFDGYHADIWGMEVQMKWFLTLALLEGSRLEERGDMAGAWTWYRAVLRAIHHVGRHGTVYRRSVAQGWHNDLLARLTRWAADPRTTPAMLRRALDDAVACEALAPSESYTLKAEYLDVDRMLDGAEAPAVLPPGSWLQPIPSLDFRLTPAQAETVYGAWRIWRREPERSRLAIRLAIAHWIAQVEQSPASRPKDPPTSWLTFEFDPLGPEAPAKARALSPRALAGWLRSTVDANFLLGSWGWTAVRKTEQANRRALLILLASQLHRRDHGSDPPSPEALVGPYLGSLPDAVDDGSEQAMPAGGKPLE